MTIKEVEEQTGLTRSNIRFYEKEKLIEPSRNDKNGYRDYSEKALSVEIFSIMFVYGLIKSVVAVLLVDTVALIGILIVGIAKVSLGHSPAINYPGASTQAL